MKKKSTVPIECPSERARNCLWRARPRPQGAEVADQVHAFAERAHVGAWSQTMSAPPHHLPQQRVRHHQQSLDVVVPVAISSSGSVKSNVGTRTMSAASSAGAKSINTASASLTNPVLVERLLRGYVYAHKRR